MSGNNDGNNTVGTVDQMNVQSVQVEARAAAEQLSSVTPAKARLVVRRTAGRPQFSKALNTSKRHKTLGIVLRARRLDLRLTQRELAVQLNVKPAHIAYLELDRRRPSLSLLSRIADVLGLEREPLILLSHPEARGFIAARPERRAKDQAWKEFKKNKILLTRHQVTKRELQILGQVSLLGRITSPRSFLFILNSIRQAVEEDEAWA
jgi:transcriptional regulator with XRE-family HTH domain